MSERYWELLMEPDIIKAEKIIRAANSAAKKVVSGSSNGSIKRRNEMVLAIMQTITDKEGLSVKNGESKQG